LSQGAVRPAKLRKALRGDFPEGDHSLEAVARVNLEERLAFLVFLFMLHGRRIGLALKGGPFFVAATESRTQVFCRQRRMNAYTEQNSN